MIRNPVECNVFLDNLILTKKVVIHPEEQLSFPNFKDKLIKVFSLNNDETSEIQVFYKGMFFFQTGVRFYFYFILFSDDQSYQIYISSTEELCDMWKLKRNPTKQFKIVCGLSTQFLSGRSVHQDIFCDYCGALPIIGPRFKCRVCESHDLCSVCFALLRFDPKNHRMEKFNHSHASKSNETDLTL